MAGQYDIFFGIVPEEAFHQSILGEACAANAAVFSPVGLIVAAIRTDQEITSLFISYLGKPLDLEERPVETQGAPRSPIIVQGAWPRVSSLTFPLLFNLILCVAVRHLAL